MIWSIWRFEGGKVGRWEGLKVGTDFAELRRVERFEPGPPGQEVAGHLLFEFFYLLSPAT
jgi:hypothetical protein